MNFWLGGKARQLGRNNKKPPAVAANPLGDRQARRRLSQVVLLLLLRIGKSGQPISCRLRLGGAQAVPLIAPVRGNLCPGTA